MYNSTNIDYIILTNKIIIYFYNNMINKNVRLKIYYTVACAKVV